jgi:ectoine hydroxylase-related dioxygenase (phytanoyl-CoA dioxygenase family)
MTAADCRIDDLRAVVEVTTELASHPYALEIAGNAVVYDSANLRPLLADPDHRDAIEAELVSVFHDGPGIAVFRSAIAAPAVVDRVSDAFRAMIADQHARGVAAGDHFAKPGANDRVWNALEKLAVLDPEAFVAYYGNEILDLASRAWLGPHYQVTSQVNVVNPGGEAQAPHADYHLGFRTDDEAECYPAHVHHLSAALTLQGAVAHVDMPIESGPTLYLPHSQKYALSYLAWRRPEFAEYFAAHHVQLPLEKGDAVFFNPKLLHAAGSNRSTTIARMANLLQISSAFGRAMESVDRARISGAIFPALLAFDGSGAEVSAAIAAAAEGYAFPTNLDRDPPLDGLAPETQADILRRALDERWSTDRFGEALVAHAERRLTH